MLTIKISKAELKKAFFEGTACFSQEITAGGTPIENENIVLLKIMLANIQPNTEGGA